MNKKQNCFATRAMVVAVHGALLAMAAMPISYAAEEVAVAELTQPGKSIEVGLRDTSKGSFKAGEYNGLESKGVSAVVNMDARGGANYDSESPVRWRISGEDLGLETRNLSAEYGRQGKFRFNFGYDELLRNRSDSYQTPLQGVGGNNLTLPAAWLVPAQLNVNPNKTGAAIVPGANARTLDTAFINNDPVYRFNDTANASAAGAPSAPYLPTATEIANMQAAAVNDNGLFRNFDIRTKRTKTDAGMEFNLSTQLSLAASMRHEVKDGYKLMSAVSRNTGGDIATVIPDMISQQTDQFNASLNYKGDKEFLQASYYGSIFTNNNLAMSWENWATGKAITGNTAVPTTSNTISSGAPSNQFHQISLAGGYDFSKSTKLVMNGSYANNSQNEMYPTAGTEISNGLPQSSLNGLVVTKAVNFKLTSRPVKDLNLTANYKLDNRDNQTAVNNYVYYDPGETANNAGGKTSVFNAAAQAGVLGWMPGGILGTNANINANRPYSKKVNLFSLDADYRLASGEAVKAGFDFEKINRYCNGTWISCIDAATTKENTLRAEWRATLDDTLTGKLGYAYSKRAISNYNENAFLALVPMANVVPGTQGTGAVAPYNVAGSQSAYSMMQTGLTGYGVVGSNTFPAPPDAGTPLNYYTSTYNAAGTLTGSNNNFNQVLYGNVNRISELIGMRRFNMADRNRNKLRSSLNWQASDQFSYQAGLDASSDFYANSVYGLQRAKSWAMNLEGTYAPDEDFTAIVFFTYEDQRSRSVGNTYSQNSNVASLGTTNYTVVSGSSCYTDLASRNANGKLGACQDWSANMRDKVDTLGLTFKQKGLMQGALELAGDFIFSHATTDNNVIGGNYVNNPAAVANAAGGAGSIASYYIAATALPAVTTDTVQLKLNSKYKVDKERTIRLSYMYSHMKAVDWAYSGMQVSGGGLTGVLPTNETAPAFTVHSVAVSYTYSFK